MASIVSVWLGFIAPAGYCQSSIVELPLRGDRRPLAAINGGHAFVSRSVSEYESAVTNSIDPAVLAFEQTLSNSSWGQVSDSATESITGQTLIERIENLGIPAILNDSSDIKSETPIVFRSSPAVGSMRLDSALTLVLESHNAEYQITPDALIICSVDEMAERLDRVVYNVSALAPTTADGSNLEWLNSLSRLIQNTVEPESWDTEGPSLVPMMRNGKSLLVIVNTYGVHRQIRRLFRDVHALSEK